MQLALSAPIVAIVALAALVGTVVGESHTVHFTNACPLGTGTPTLIQGPNVLPIVGGSYTVGGPLNSTIAYLQTGNCGFNGENCTFVELALDNAVGSQADINITPPHRFSVPTGFKYYNGCGGQGAYCASATSCNTTPVPCLADNVNLNITFCVQ